MSAASRRARAAAVHGRRAGLVSRLLADGIDFFVVGLLLFSGLVGIAAVRYFFNGDFEMPQIGAVFSAAAYPFVAIVYLTLFWSATGRSVGKHLLGLRVVRDNGAPVGVLRSFGRSLICVFTGLFTLAWVAVSRRNAGVHDLVVRTSVVHDWATAREVSLEEIPSVGLVIPEGEPV
jgi:uncharacterized RDD family membrane protein YckC